MLGCLEFMDDYSIETGEELVRIARKAITDFVSNAKFDRAPFAKHSRKFLQRHGIYVRVEHWPTRTPRGSMGFVNPSMPLGRSLIEAAIGAAEDKGFVPISHRELEHIVVEVDLLSKPEEVRGSAAAKLKKIKTGRDGVMIAYGYHAGAVLPISASENNWKSEEMLRHACVNAGLDPDTWRREDVKVQKFTSQVFRELSPEGPTEEMIFG